MFPAWSEIAEVAKGRLFNFLWIGLFLRLLIAPFVGHPYDSRVFMSVGWSVGHGLTPYGQYTLQEIFSNPSHPHLHGTFYGIGYPPPWGIICGLMYTASHAFSSSLYAYNFALKIPIILGDLATSFLVYKILKRRLGVRGASKAYFAYLFCPYLILVGVVWGMFDVLAFFFSLLSAYWLQEKRALSISCLSISCALKLIPLVLIPLYSIFIWKSTGSWRKAGFYFFSVVCLVTAFTLVPMIAFNWPLSNLYHALFSQLNVMDIGPYGQASFMYGCASPFNVLNLIRLSNPTFTVPSFLNYLWVPACVLVYLPAAQAHTKVDLASVLRWSLLTMLVFFTTRSWVSDQNLLFLFSFLMLTTLMESHCWRTIHALWVSLSIFVLVHVPAIAFLWIPNPWTLDVATAFCDGPFGPIRLFAMSGLTLGWLGLSWHFVLKKTRWRKGEDSYFVAS